MDTSRRLACKRCQIRKIKCNRVQPCSNCIQGGHGCEFRTNDGRKRPVSHKYLSALEARLAYFESVIQKLKKASSAEREDILAGVSLDDHLENTFELDHAIDHSSPDTPGPSQTLALRSGPQGTLQFHGPTSIYINADATQSPSEGGHALPTFQEEVRSSSPSLDGFAILRLATALGVDDALIRKTLPLFFLHQYPFCMFVYREAFLSDYYDNSCGGRYWSYPLVYAMCALGAPHSERSDVRAKAALMAKCAQEIIISHCLTRPSPTTIQAISMRLDRAMPHKAGCSQEWHFAWDKTSDFIKTPHNGSYRTEILFMSLYLGRPVYLREDDATVFNTEPLPDFPSNHAWYGLSEIALKHSSEELQRPQLTAALMHMVSLGKIFQDMMADIFSMGRNSPKSDSYRTSRLGDLNLRLSKWQASLPEALQWSEWSTNKGVHPHVLVLHLYYHAMLLSLNRHFVRPSTGFPHSKSSREICTSSTSTISTLIRQYRTHNGLHTAPLMLVYALVMAIITQVQILASGREGLSLLSKALDECAQYYKIAAEARTRLAPFLGQPASAGDTERRTTQNFPEPADGKSFPSSLQNTNVTDEHLDPTALSNDLGLESFDSTAMDPMLQIDPFDATEFGDLDDGLHSWFTIGQMG